MSELTASRIVHRAVGSRRSTERFTATEASILVLLVCALIGVALLSRSPERQGLRTASVDIESGDTLWGMAQQYPVSGLSTGETVELIADLNRLESPVLIAGGTLKVPLQGTPDGVAMR